MNMEINIAEKGSALWEETIAFAEKCSWRAGSELARQMRGDVFQGFERVFAASENGRIAGFCTLTEKDELSPEYPYSPFIGFVFVSEDLRGRRVSEQMIRSVLAYAESIGFDRVYLMSGETGLYEKYGFVKMGDYETIYGGSEQLFVIGTHENEADNEAVR